MDTFLNGLAQSSYYLSRGSKRKVANLIDFNQHCWREDKIPYFFLHHEADDILQISLKPSWIDEKIIWNLHRQIQI